MTTVFERQCLNETYRPDRPAKDKTHESGSGILVLHVEEKQQKLYICLIFLQYIELAWI